MEINKHKKAEKNAAHSTGKLKKKKKKDYVINIDYN